MKVRTINFSCHTKGSLVGEQVAEGPLNGFLHGALHATGEFELTRADGSADLEAIQPDGPITADRSGVDRSGRERVCRDEVPTTLLGNADEVLFAGVVNNVAEGGVVVLERAHFLELFFHAAPAFERER